MRPGSLRIVAGELRNRRLVVPSGLAIRPTSERVREALFDILGPRIAGAHVLDAFAGSGALGLEALSRGAALVTFVEADPVALAALRRNIAALGVGDRCGVTGARFEALPPGSLPGAPFEFVLADPPYDSPLRAGLVARIGAAGVLAPRGLLVVERARRNAPDPDPAEALALVRTARYGDTCLDFYAAGPS